MPSTRTLARRLRRTRGRRGASSSSAPSSSPLVVLGRPGGLPRPRRGQLQRQPRGGRGPARPGRGGGPRRRRGRGDPGDDRRHPPALPARPARPTVQLRELASTGADLVVVGAQDERVVAGPGPAPVGRAGRSAVGPRARRATSAPRSEPVRPRPAVRRTRWRRARSTRPPATRWEVTPRSSRPGSTGSASSSSARPRPSRTTTSPGRATRPSPWACSVSTDGSCGRCRRLDDLPVEPDATLLGAGADLVQDRRGADRPRRAAPAPCGGRAGSAPSSPSRCRWSSARPRPPRAAGRLYRRAGARDRAADRLRTATRASASPRSWACPGTRPGGPGRRPWPDAPACPNPTCAPSSTVGLHPTTPPSCGSPTTSTPSRGRSATRDRPHARARSPRPRPTPPLAPAAPAGGRRPRRRTRERRPGRPPRAARRGGQGRRRPGRRRHRASSSRCSAAATCCSRACPGSPRPCWSAPSPRRCALDTKRVQFTPDLMPGDVTGSLVYDARTSEFSFRPGPGLHQPAARRRDQPDAAEDPGVAAGGDGGAPGLRRRASRARCPTRSSSCATQNPIEYEGTYPLPEAQLDRFLLKLTLPLPAREEEIEVLARHAGGFDPRDLAAAGVRPVAGARRARGGPRRRRARSPSPPRCSATPSTSAGPPASSPSLSLGVSPRGATALLAAARAWAWLSARDYVTPDDVKALARPGAAAPGPAARRGRARGRDRRRRPRRRAGRGPRPALIGTRRWLSPDGSPWSPWSARSSWPAWSTRPGWSPGAALLVVNGILLAGVLLDLALAGSVRGLLLSRTGDTRVRLGEVATVELLVTNPGRRAVRGRVRDAWPPSAGVVEQRHGLDVPPGERRRVTSTMRPTRRGDRRAARVTVRSAGPLGLAARQGSHLVPWTRPHAAAVHLAQAPAVQAGPAPRARRADRRSWCAGRAPSSTRCASTSTATTYGPSTGGRPPASGDLVVRTWRPGARPARAARPRHRPHGRRAGRRRPAPGRRHGRRAPARRAGRRGRATGSTSWRTTGSSAPPVLGAPSTDLLHQLVQAMAPLDAGAGRDRLAGRRLRRSCAGRATDRSWCCSPPWTRRRWRRGCSRCSPSSRAGTGCCSRRSPTRGSPSWRPAGGTQTRSTPRPRPPRRLAARGHLEQVLRRQGVDVVDAPPDTLPPALADAYLALKAAGRL